MGYCAEMVLETDVKEDNKIEFANKINRKKTGNVRVM
jgi:hypothetical protein